MLLPLPLHLFIHFALAVFIGYLAGRHFKKIRLGIIAGVVGGFFIDLDHVLEYFLVFGPHFNFHYFWEGREFLISDRVYLWFHAWEYAPVILLAAWLFWRKNKISVATFLIALTLGGFVHLATDCVLSLYPPQNYSLIYRWQRNFSSLPFSSSEQYWKNSEQK